jgi:hypothetical protein
MGCRFEPYLWSQFLLHVPDVRLEDHNSAVEKAARLLVFNYGIAGSLAP